MQTEAGIRGKYEFYLFGFATTTGVAFSGSEPAAGVSVSVIACGNEAVTPSTVSTEASFIRGSGSHSLDFSYLQKLFLTSDEECPLTSFQILGEEDLTEATSSSSQISSESSLLSEEDLQEIVSIDKDGGITVETAVSSEAISFILKGLSLGRQTSYRMFRLRFQDPPAFEEEEEVEQETLVIISQP
mmetsp:Transcript_39250/g.59876  ORF Transcript_39250/g.59876 Transcript_39250/m.59876 type:complete len:187 (-) Transcript_39250:2048-2608(-)